jgi:hypothetical protein
MTETKKSEEAKKPTLKEELDSIAFKNRDINMIRDLKQENAKLKDKLGRGRKSSGDSGIGIAGLARLGDQARDIRIILNQKK